MITNFTATLEFDKLESLAKKADPIFTDLYGDRYSQGSWSRADFDKEQDDFISTFTPAVVLQLIALARAADQQPATPSGALADNDDGVA